MNKYRTKAASDTSSEDEKPPQPSSRYKHTSTSEVHFKTPKNSQFSFTTTPNSTTGHDPISMSSKTAAIPSVFPKILATTTDPKPMPKMNVSADKRELSAHLAMLRSVSGHQEEQLELAASPVFTMPVLQHSMSSFSQYGFLAGNADILDSIAATGQDATSIPPSLDPRVFFNISTPTSAFICGSQGSGKSHTLSCLLENCLLSSSVSKLDSPLSGLLFHYDSFTSDLRGTPCEAAHLSSNPNIKVRIICSPSNIQTIKRTYTGLNVKIEPLKISQNDLNTKRMMDLMAVNTEDGRMPLYLHEVTRILREIRVLQQQNGRSFNYAVFKREVNLSPMTPAQLAPLTQRLDTLESFMPKSQTQVKDKGTVTQGNTDGNNWTTKAGHVTIVDLSCPCVTSEAACALFNMCLSLFLEQKTTIGRIISLDEAHKYMNAGSEATTLTNTLLSSIRLQRHLGTRVFISTQEPSISPKLLDLCSITIVHRFTSPDWLRCLKSHLAALDNDDGLTTNPKLKLNNVFNQIVKLKVGQALLFAPSAVVDVRESSDSRSGKKNYEIQKLGIEYLRVKIRDRLTADGGRSVLALGIDSTVAAKTPVATAGTSLFGEHASVANSSGISTSTAPATVSMFGIAAKTEKTTPSVSDPTSSSKDSSTFNKNTPPAHAGATPTTVSSKLDTKAPSRPHNVNEGVSAITRTVGSVSDGGKLESATASAESNFDAEASSDTSENKAHSGATPRVTIRVKHSDTHLSSINGNVGTVRAASTQTRIGIEGSFTKSTAVLPDTPTTQWGFLPFSQEDLTTGSNEMLRYNSITFVPSWKEYSFEELRLGDYSRGHTAAGLPK